MAPLTWKNVDAPDLSKASDILNNAANMWAGGFGNMSGALKGVRENQKERRSAEALPILAKVASEQGVDAALSQVDQLIRTQDMTDEFQKLYMGARATGMGFDSTRITNTSMSDANNRQNETHDRQIKREDDLYSITPTLATAAQKGMYTTASVDGIDFAAEESSAGLPAGYLGRTAQLESGGDPNAKNPNSSAGGLFQVIDSTAKAYGLTNKFDPKASTATAVAIAKDGQNALRKALGREPTGAELYLAHQQGAGGAVALLSNPNALAVDIVGADAVRNNGGDLNMTAGQFASKWLNKYDGSQGLAGIDMGALLQGKSISPDEFLQLMNSTYGLGEKASSDADANRSRDWDNQTKVDAKKEADDAKAKDEATTKYVMDMVQTMSPGQDALNNSIQTIMMDEKLDDASKMAAIGKLKQFVSEQPEFFAAPGDTPTNSALTEAVTTGFQASRTYEDATDPTKASAAIMTGAVKGNPGVTAATPDGVDPAAPAGAAAGGAGGGGGGQGSGGGLGQGASAAAIISDLKARGLIGDQDTAMKYVQEVADELKLPVATVARLAESSIQYSNGWLSAETTNVSKESLLAQASAFKDSGSYDEAVRNSSVDKARDEEALKIKADEAKANLENGSLLARGVPETDPRIVKNKEILANIPARLAKLVVTPETRQAMADKAQTSMTDLVNTVSGSIGLQPASNNANDALATEVAKAEAKPVTEGGWFVDPNGTGFKQSVQRSGREADLSSTLMKIGDKLATEGGSAASRLVGSMSDYFNSTPEEAQKNAARRDTLSEALDWFRGDEAYQHFNMNPSELAEAQRDPTGFYLNMKKKAKK